MKWVLLALLAIGCDGYHLPMSHTLTPVATFSTPLTVPDDGDACNAASVETPFQSLVNQTQVLFNGLLNVKVRPSLRSVNGTDIVIGAVPMIIGTEGGNWKALAYTGGTYSPAGLASGTWYYLYARITTGSITISHSTTSPDSFLRTMNGNTDYVFLGSFRTDGSGVIIPFFARGSKVTYAASLTAVTDSGVPTTFTDLSLGSFVPPHAQRALITALGTPDGASDVGYIVTKGVTATGYTSASAAAYKIYLTSSTSTVRFEFEVQTDTSQVIQYKFDTGGAGSLLIVDVVGYTE